VTCTALGIGRGVVCTRLPRQPQLTQGLKAPPVPAQGLSVVLFGVPDMGKVCAEKHVPSYLQHMDQLRAAGVDKVVCLAVAKPEAVQAWGAKVGIDGVKVVAAPPACA